MSSDLRPFVAEEIRLHPRVAYQGILADGLRPAAALRQAQLAVAQQKRWQHPYYWAGFQLQGDWN